MIIADPDVIAWGANRLNKLLRQEANRTVLRLNHGLNWLMKQPPELVGRTPWETVYSYDRLNVYRYLNDESHPRQVPVVLIPPLGVKPYVYDLLPGHSMVEALLKSSFRVYSMDFGVPEYGEMLNFERYITSWIPRALNEIRRAERHKGVTLAGYCLGGIFGLIYTAFAKDKQVKNLVTFATPFDGYELYPSKMLVPLNRMVSGPVALLIDLLGTVPGIFLKFGWRLLNPYGAVTKYFKLVRNLWDPQFVDYYNALDKWTNDFINYPAEVISQIYSSLLVNNDLVNGTLELGGKQVDIRWISCPVLSFAGEGDFLVSPKSAKALTDTVSSKEKAFYMVPGGHLGAVTGAYAPQEVWSVMCDWLAKRS